MPRRPRPDKLAVRLLSDIELSLLRTACASGDAKYADLKKVCGFSLNAEFDVSLARTGYRLGRVMESHTPEYLTSKDKLTTQQLKEVQEYLLDEHLSEREIAKRMYEKYNQEIFSSHTRFRKALNRSGWRTKLWLLPIKEKV
jgi:hypothetical protein